MSEESTLMLKKSTFKVGDKINFNVGKIYLMKNLFTWCTLAMCGLVYVEYTWCMLNIRYACSVNSVC